MHTNIGVLVHSRHIQTVGWEELVWGLPAQNKLGDFPKLVELLLQEVSQRPITCIVTGSTDTKVGNMYDGEYAKKYLLDRFDQLHEFPRLKILLDKLSDEQQAQLRKRLENLIVTKPLKNTAEEITHSAQLFSERGIHEVIQIASASHGPRCIQLQAAARFEGKIPIDQQWYVVLSDMCFEGTDPKDTVVLETPHRGDDPMLGFKPTLPQALKPYYYELPTEDKKKLNLIIDEFIKQHRLTA